MKCYTVTEKGITPGIRLLPTPYPHVPVGDPRVSSADYRRVEIDPALMMNAQAQAIAACSIEIAYKEGERRRSSYKLIPPKGGDDDQALVKFEANCATGDGRTFYDFPRDTFTVAKGWYSHNVQGPRVQMPVELAVLKKDCTARVLKVEDIAGRPALVFGVVFDGATLKLEKGGPEN